MHLALVIEATPERVFDSLLTEHCRVAAGLANFNVTARRRTEWPPLAPSRDAQGELHLMHIRRDELITWSQDWPAPLHADITLAALTGPATWLTFSSQFLDPADENAQNAALMEETLIPFFTVLQLFAENHDGVVRDGAGRDGADSGSFGVGLHRLDPLDPMPLPGNSIPRH